MSKNISLNQSPWHHRPIIPTIILGTLLLLPLVLYGIPHFYRPARLPETRLLFPGVTYERQILTQPRPVVLHLVTIDLLAPGIRVFVTPGQAAIDHETNARTVSEFLTEFKLQVAINANFFHAFHDETPWDYYPHTGDPVDNLGQVISNGTIYSPAQSEWPVICFAAHRAQIVDNTCPAGTQQAVAGNDRLVSQGQRSPNLAALDRDKPYPRVAVALDQTGQTLWLIVVDGKQRLYSEGLKSAELAEIALRLGADSVLNLDGGGSTTLAIATPHGAQVLNAPIHTKIPLRERPVANHLGFYAQ
jgi:hypothetical protein